MANTQQTPAQASKGERFADWFDGRVGLYSLAKANLRKIFPDHWSFMLGEVALYSFVIIIVTGVYLTMFFKPSMTEVVYHGRYAPLNGILMSDAYKSTLDISFDVRGGLLLRQLHHWAALVFIMAMLVHMMRVFFTGAFRKPRELNWLFGASLLILGMFDGFMGYSLPDDLLSGTGVRFMEGAILSLPIVGTYLVFFIFGGQYPGHIWVPRMYTVHVLLIPGIMAAALAAHLILVFYHKHTQGIHAGRKNDNVVGMPLMPVYMAKAGGFFFLVSGIISVFAGFAQINPIWAYGPYRPDMVTTDAQPDWYMGFSEGLIRVMPGWEINFLGHTLVLGVFIPLVVFPLVFLAIWCYPFFEAWVTGDRREHHIAERPRNNPVRTAFGAAWIAEYVILLVGGGNDIIAVHFHLSINAITWLVRVGFFVIPALVFVVTHRWCLGLQRRDREKVLHGRESGVIARYPHGEYVEIHEPLSQEALYTLTAHEQYTPWQLPPAVDENGNPRKISWLQRVRARLSEAYFGEGAQIPKATVEEFREIQAAHHEHHEVARVGEGSH
ncbi:MULTISPECIES: cytochrome bc1 complex cytochrome b subunit [Streptomyces]|uniref:Cytochrome bc1 complex cytochrome b subunit n=1 Tax=Streptomyces morookaense TaxID=1970 RepID=A0A7Y7B143_STRMO|nr:MULTISPECIES: cytochrome bc complex cytochrome b subunit [Streptomyces]MCC2275112.1 cytochrome bc complex cytochrome b subunit [Streptomyces sp. ET3-23]NVK76884.1 cytochrome bc complex cytochrome b subunit [Streptomyces morookaense]GHF25833.1 cytochrome bc1 complex cytochrome b subunit [Streptomyces morookaense]